MTFEEAMQKLYLSKAEIEGVSVTVRENEIELNNPKYDTVIILKKDEKFEHYVKETLGEHSVGYILEQHDVYGSETMYACYLNDEKLMLDMNMTNIDTGTIEVLVDYEEEDHDKYVGFTV